MGSSDQDGARFTVDFAKREALMNIETIGKTTNFTFEVVEAIYAVDVLTQVSQISKQASLTGSIEIEYIELAVDEDNAESIGIIVNFEDSDEFVDDGESIVLPPVAEAGEVVTYDAEGNEEAEPCTDCDSAETEAILTFGEEDEFGTEDRAAEEVESENSEDAKERKKQKDEDSDEKEQSPEEPEEEL